MHACAGTLTPPLVDGINLQVIVQNNFDVHTSCNNRSGEDIVELINHRHGEWSASYRHLNVTHYLVLQSAESSVAVPLSRHLKHHSNTMVTTRGESLWLRPFQLSLVYWIPLPTLLAISIMDYQRLLEITREY